MGEHWPLTLGAPYQPWSRPPASDCTHSRSNKHETLCKQTISISIVVIKCLIFPQKTCKFEFVGVKTIFFLKLLPKKIGTFKIEMEHLDNSF